MLLHVCLDYVNECCCSRLQLVLLLAPACLLGIACYSCMYAHLLRTVYDGVLQGNYKNGFVYWIILMITFWILYSYLVPISLFVTLEIVKFWQGFLYINHDKEMKVQLSAHEPKYSSQSAALAARNTVLCRPAIVLSA